MIRVRNSLSYVPRDYTKMRKKNQSGQLKTSSSNNAGRKLATIDRVVSMNLLPSSVIMQLPTPTCPGRWLIYGVVTLYALLENNSAHAAVAGARTRVYKMENAGGWRTVAWNLVFSRRFLTYSTAGACETSE